MEKYFKTTIRDDEIGLPETLIIKYFQIKNEFFKIYERKTPKTKNLDFILLTKNEQQNQHINLVINNELEIIKYEIMTKSPLNYEESIMISTYKSPVDIIKKNTKTRK